MNQKQQEINQTLHQFQVLLNKALQQDSRTMFRLSVGKLLEVESLLSPPKESSEETLEQNIILIPTTESLVEDSNPESLSDNFKDISDNISDIENKEK